MSFTQYYLALKAKIAPWKFLERNRVIRLITIKILKKNLKNGIVFDEHKINLQPHDIGVGLELLATKEYEAQSMRICKELLKPGMTFVDAGAHVGIYSLMAARCVGREGRVIACEPDDGNFDLLCKNIRENNYSNIETKKLAISDQDGCADFYTSEINPSDHRLLLGGNNRKVSMVECVTLDSLLKDEKRVDLIKIDVQGMEGRVLRGMKKIIQKFPSIHIVFEFSPSALEELQDDPSRILKDLEMIGMKLFLIDEIHGSLRPTNTSNVLASCPTGSYVNILCRF